MPFFVFVSASFSLSDFFRCLFQSFSVLVLVSFFLPRDAAVHLDTYRILQRHRAVSLPQHAFLVGLCLQTAVNYLSKSDKY